MRKSLIRLEIHKTAVSDIDHFIGLISASPYQKKKKRKHPLYSYLDFVTGIARD